MTPARLTAAFLDDAEGRVFALLRRPKSGDVRGCVLVAPPFAEEMNKSRKMLTELASGLAQRGIATVLVDPYGTGESEGEFAAADWQRWVCDLRSAAAWSEAQGCRVTGLLGVRLGCALGAEAARGWKSLDATAFWQPVLEGSRTLDQFLRLRVAAAMMEHDRNESTAELRRRLRIGETIEVAGYEVSGRLAADLDAVRLHGHLGPHLGALGWFEVVRTAEAAAPMPAIKAADAARAAGVEVALETVHGEAFWSSVEIVTNAALLERSTEFFDAALGRATATRSRVQRQG